MAEISDHLLEIDNHKPQKTAGGHIMSALDMDYKNMQQQLKEYFLSKSIDLTMEAHLMTISKTHRKIFIYSSPNIIVFSLDSNLVESFHDTGIATGCSIACNSESIWLGTADAELIQISYPSFTISGKARIGKRNLYISCWGDEGVWTGSHGYTMYYYNIKQDKVFKLGSFPFCTAIAVSSNEEYLAIYGTRKQLNIYSRRLRFLEVELKYQYDIFSIDFSNDSTLFAVAIQDQIIVYTASNWKTIGKIQVDGQTHLKFYGEHNSIIFCCKRTIGIWNPLSKNTEQEFVYECHFEKVTSIVIDEKNNFAYLLNSSSNMYRHLLPNSNYLPFPRVISGEFSNMSEHGYYVSKKGSLVKVNTSKMEIEILSNENFHIKNIYGYCMSDTDSCIFIMHDDKITKFSDDTLTELSSIDITKDNTYLTKCNLMKVVNSRLYIIDFGIFCFTDFDKKRLDIINITDINPQAITEIKGIIYINNGPLIIKIHRKKIIRSGVGHKSDIIHLFSSNLNELVSLTKNSAKLWLCSPLIEVRVHHFDHEIFSACMSESKTQLFIGTWDKIKGYFLPNFVEFFSIDTESDAHKIQLAFGQKYIIGTLKNNKLIRIINPAGRNFSISANYLDANKAIKIVEGKLDEYDPKCDNWFIFPYGINALHCYTYHNKYQLLKCSLENNGAYITSTLGDLITIALKKNYRECINVILSSLRSRVVNDFYALQCIEDKIIQLNCGSYKGLDELYEACFVLDSKTDLPAFCSEITKLPKLRLSSIIDIAPFLNDEELSESAARIEYYTSTIGLNFTIGSKDSINFLRSLQECENTEIFYTKFIKEVLKMKWEIVFKYIMIQSSLYLLYLVLLILHVLYENDYYLIACFVLNIFLLIYEGIQMISDVVEYFKDLWNYVDLSRTLLLIIYAVILYFYDKIHELLFSLVALSMIRGITLFRLFYNTRYMISLLSQVLKSLTAFSCVLIYSTISFALLSKTVGDDESKYAFLHQISHIYALQIGAFEVNDDWHGLRWVIFISATIIELIIMMNLLISLLGDTYSGVEEVAEVEDLKQLIEIILEIENLYFWNKPLSGKQYIQNLWQF